MDQKALPSTIIEDLMLIPLELVHNVSLLIAIAVLFDVMEYRWRIPHGWIRALLSGLLIGLITLAVMNSSWKLSPGVVFDTRSVALTISGLFFGPLPTGIAMGMAALFRTWQGGAGATMGVLVIASSGGMGLLWRYRYRQTLATLSFGSLYRLGWGVHLIMLVLMLFLPSHVIFPTLKAITLPVLLLYPLATALLGGLMVSRLYREQQLEETIVRQQTLETILHTIHQAVFWKDREGRFLGCNQLFAKMVGNCTPAEVIGKTDRDFAGTREHAQAYLADDRQVILTNQPRLHIIEPLVLADGQSIWVDTSKSPLRDGQGKPWGVLGVLEDITERQLAENRLRENQEQLNWHIQELQSSNEELSRFNQLAIGRELQMIALKQEINTLCERLGETRRYDLAFADPSPAYVDARSENPDSVSPAQTDLSGIEDSHD
jgi:PAS domain S-box-containing protein